MADPITTPALYFHPDAYDLAHGKLMGRQSAGYGFLRAAVAGRGDSPVVGYARGVEGRREFEQLVAGIDPAAATEWLGARSGAVGLKRRRVLHRPDPIMTTDARLRLRAGPAAYSLTGVTHSLSSWSPLDAIAGALSEPLEPWDAVICTSHAAAEVARRVQETEADYLRWRLGPGVRLSGPQTPVIPLGVHVDDFAHIDGRRAQARAELAIPADEVAVLYVGRLIFHGKAHPYPLLVALQAIARRGGVKPALVLYGQSPNEPVAAAYRQAAAQYAPDVRTVILDGAAVDPAVAWAAGDVFCSLADNIQETFGLTPVEAMACGLPCVVSDWDGYKDTVREGVDGFRIRTFAPAPGSGEAVAAAYEGAELNYNLYLWATSVSTALDIPQLTDRLEVLIGDADLRRTMGEAGRARARTTYDWAVVYRQYVDLWNELDARREHALADPEALARLRMAPRAVSAFPDPFSLFSHFASALITPLTPMRPAPGASLEQLQRLASSALFRNTDLDERITLAVWTEVLGGVRNARQAAIATGCTDGEAIRAMGILAKMGLLALPAD
jgi:glycosyltransferase involved in cell wall biosynthesis